MTFIFADGREVTIAVTAKLGSLIVFDDRPVSVLVNNFDLQNLHRLGDQAAHRLIGEIVGACA